MKCIKMSDKNKLAKYEELLNKKAFAHLSTIMPDGSPQTTPVWFDFQDDVIRINTAVGRQKDKNMRRSPKVALSIQDPDNPYSYVAIRGEILEKTEKGADEHIDSLAQKYMGIEKYPYRTPTETRIIYKIKPLSVSGL